MHVEPDLPLRYYPRVKITAAVLGLLLVSSCEKAGDKASGAMSTDEAALLPYLPAGSTALFGGNYMKFQNFLQNSPLAKLMSTVEKTSPGLQAWMTCWTENTNIKMLGSVRIDGGGATLRFVMSGMGFDEIDKCGKRANFPSTIDPDHKFLAFEMPTAAGTIKNGYLLLPNGAVLSRQTLKFGAARMTPPPVLRADLEADVAALSAGTAAKDTALLAAAAKLDHSKAWWFVGSAEGTPVGDKVGEVSGTFDLAGGLAIDVSVALKQASLADKIEEGVGDAKKKVDMIGGATGEVVKSLQVTRKGDTLRFAVSISNDQFTAMMSQLAPMMGALGGRRQ